MEIHTHGAGQERKDDTEGTTERGKGKERGYRGKMKGRGYRGKMKGKIIHEM